MVAPSHLKSLQAVELAARLGSLKAAADVLMITPAAVGQRVKALEDYLGVELLLRGRTGLRPSAQLEAALPHLRAAFRDLERAAAELEFQRTREIHVAAPSDFVELWLLPRLEAFRAAHANTRFCINGEGDAPHRLSAVDCEISFSAPPADEGADFLFDDFVAPICSQENMRRIAHLPEPDRLEGFPLLHLDFYRNDPAILDWARWVQAHEMRRTAPERGFRFQRIAPAIEAVLAEAGIAMCGLALIGALVEAQAIRLPFPIATGMRTSHAYRARFRSAASSRSQVRRFRDWLLGESQATQAWLSETTSP